MFGAAGARTRLAAAVGGADPGAIPAEPADSLDAIVERNTEDEDTAASLTALFPAITAAHMHRIAVFLAGQ